jgi:hypothetical protein
LASVGYCEDIEKGYFYAKRGSRRGQGVCSVEKHVQPAGCSAM